MLSKNFVGNIKQVANMLPVSCGGNIEDTSNMIPVNLGGNIFYVDEIDPEGTWPRVGRIRPHDGTPEAQAKYTAELQARWNKICQKAYDEGRFSFQHEDVEK